MDFNKYFNDLPAELGSKDFEERVKLLKLFAYNAYFNADPLYIDNVDEGVCVGYKGKHGIDGVYLNESLEETTIELVYSYWVYDNKFEISSVINALSIISANLSDINRKMFTTGNPKAEDLISNYLNDSESKNVLIRIITNFIPTEDEKFEISKKVQDYSVSVKGLSVSSAIMFNDDIEGVVESNVAPFDYVEKDKLELDKPNNILYFDDGSFVCNIKATSLKELWKKEGNRGLLAMNLRYYIPKKNIDEKLSDSILFHPDNFWFLNNGIIIVCDKFSFKGNSLILEHFSIVNGGQTTRMIGETPVHNDFLICCKVIKNKFSSTSEKNAFVASVAEATNTQKPIVAKDIIANRIEQRNLKTLFSNNGIFIEIKRGEKCAKEAFPEPWQKTKNNELAQAIYSFVFMQPGPSRNSVSSILENDQKYDRIFVSHTFSIGFYKSLLKIMKAMKEYTSYIKKLEDIDPVKKGLVKNGGFYCLAVIGYLLKFIYNPEFKKDIGIYKNNPAYYNIYSEEPAFDHAFIDESLSYAEFKKKAYTLFDFIFDMYICSQFELAKIGTPSLAYSNWTKVNTGFNIIRQAINWQILESHNETNLDMFKSFFIEISEDQVNKNIDKYVDYVKANKTIKSKTASGEELSDSDANLRDELMTFRLKYCAEKGLSEKTMYTDKMIDKLVLEKPESIDKLKKIVSPKTTYFVGDQLLAIIAKYL